jgi:hypothetical protein
MRMILLLQSHGSRMEEVKIDFGTPEDILNGGRRED